MRIKDNFTRFFSSLSTTQLFLLAISPFLLSLLVHIIILSLSNYLTWTFPDETVMEEKVPATIILAGKADNRLKFQGTDLLDSFKTDDKMVYPDTEIEYRPITPNVDFYPESKVGEELDLISVEAAAMDHKWVNPSTGRQPLHTGPEKLVGSFSRHLQVLREGGLDVVFVFDATFSMVKYLREVTYKIENLATTFRKLVPTCRIGLVAYRDVGDDFITKIQPLTYGTLSLHNFLTDIEARGGGDWEEAVDEAIRVAVEEFNWNERSKKIILLIGDAPPRAGGFSRVIDLIGKFREDMGGRLAALDTRDPRCFRERHEDPQMVMEEFRRFAEIGGGECARLFDEETVIKGMVVLVFGGRWEMYLDEFMKNL